MSQPQTGAGSRSAQPVVVQIPPGPAHGPYSANGHPPAAAQHPGGARAGSAQSEQTMVAANDMQNLQARQLSEDVLRPLKNHLEQGWQAAVKGVTQHLVAAERHKEDQLLALQHELRGTHDEISRAHAELQHLRQVDAAQKIRIGELERMLQAANESQAQHNIAALQHRIAEQDRAIANKESLLETARHALAAAQPSVDNVLRMVDIRVQDMQTLALRLEDALHRPTLRAVYDAVRDEAFLLFRLIAFANLMKPLHDPHPAPVGHILRDPAAIDAFLHQKLPELEDHFKKLASSPVGQPSAPPPSSAPPGFAGLPRPAHRVRLPGSSTSTHAPQPEWAKPLSQVDPTQDVALQAAQQKQAILHAKKQLGSPTTQQQSPVTQRPRSDSQRSAQVQQHPHPHTHPHPHVQYPQHPRPGPYPVPQQQGMVIHPPRPQLLPPASADERPPMLRPAQWDDVHSPVHTRPQSHRSRPPPSQAARSPTTPLQPPQPQRLPPQSLPPPEMPVKVKQEEVSDPEPDSRPLTPSPPLNTTPLPSAGSVPRQMSHAPSSGPPPSEKTPAAPMDQLQDPAYSEMVKEITAIKLRSVWRAAPGAGGKLHCILCAQMRDAGDTVTENEPQLLSPDTPDEQLSAHCMERHKLVWETALRSEIAERLHGEDDDMDDDDEGAVVVDDDMDLEEGEVR